MAKQVQIKQNSWDKTFELIDFDIVESLDNAEPTNRQLEGSSDYGYAEEWQEPAILPDGRKCMIMYLFDEKDITDEYGDPKDADRYPWDANHVSYVWLDEE